VARVGANKAHGQRLCAGDLMNAVRIAVEQFPDKSQVMIAEQVGCSQSTVSRVREELMHVHKLIIPDRTVGKDGKSRPATRKRTAKPGATAPDGETPAAAKPLEAPSVAHSEPGAEPESIPQEPTDDTNESNSDGVNLPRYTLTVAGRNVKSVEKKAREAFGTDAVLRVEKVSTPESRSERLAVAEGLISDARAIVEELQGEIDGWRENLPEGLQDSGKVSQLEACSESLGEAIEAIDAVDFGNVQFPGMY